ncbi:chromosome segregation and condensation protein ScpA [Alkaliphilus metalliredigens QYMF]|uniref:Segregation and condensation protein A n=1 Tax=Alkaliphilus metalliredigens (strain QYMF) TaxID=293826 RepID=A6TR66_ALKMQ|nr:segregation/condensation protein A [Alkaliphilus metalliredigens]ABR48684.1 chromosome segregation and condensation protein ScpA [Alkaliphilus metalliredigens QYMF]
MAYNIKIEAFEGPFDLLFHLLEKNEIEIYDIPIHDITEQYVDYLKQMEHLDLDVTSEFLLMAATLLEIKSKMLLPRPIIDDQQLEIGEIDPREELVKRLLEYKKYKNAAGELRDKEDSLNRLYFKPREEFIIEKEIYDEVLEGMDLTDLIGAFEKIIQGKFKHHVKVQQIREMQREEVSIEKKVQDLIHLINENGTVSFHSLFSDTTSKIEVITTFLALLELIKMNKIIIQQTKSFESIMIKEKNLSQ